MSAGAAVSTGKTSLLASASLAVAALAVVLVLTAYFGRRVAEDALAPSPSPRADSPSSPLVVEGLHWELDAPHGHRAYVRAQRLTLAQSARGPFALQIKKTIALEGVQMVFESASGTRTEIDSERGRCDGDRWTLEGDVRARVEGRRSLRANRMEWSSGTSRLRFERAAFVENDAPANSSLREDRIDLELDLTQGH
jgi:hypothetical protein